MGPRRARPTRAWSPPASASPIAATAPRDLEVRWSTDATGHLAVYRPPCGTPGCRAPSMAWCRCPACRKILGRCRDHVLDQPLAEVRAEHGAGRCR